MVSKRQLAKWRYKTVKGWIHRVRKFKKASLNNEERIAWGKVETWMLTIIENKYLSDGGVISLDDQDGGSLHG